MWISIQRMWFAQLAQFAGEWFFFNLHLSRTKCVLNKFFLFTNQKQPLQSFWYEHHCECYKKLASKLWLVLNMILRNYSLCQLALKMKNFHLISNEKKQMRSKKLTKNSWSSIQNINLTRISINKMFLFEKDIYEPNHQTLIKKYEQIGKNISIIY